MKQIIFNLKNAWAGIASKKLLSAIVVAAMAVGLIFPTAVLMQINFYRENYANPFYSDIEHTAVAEVNITCYEEEVVEMILKSLGGNIKKTGFFVSYSTTWEYDGTSRIETVAGCNRNYFDVSRTELLNGRLLTDEEMETGAKVCLVRASAKSDMVGKKIKLAGTEFEVVGAIRDNKIYGKFLMPYNTIRSWTGDKMTQSKAYLLCDGEPDMNEINASIEESQTISKHSLLTAAEAQADLKQRVSANYKQKLIIGAVITIFSVISFILIIMGRIFNEQYVLGVKTAMGATKGQLFWDLIVQNFILIQLSAIIAMAFAYFSETGASEATASFGGMVIAAVEILCVIITLIITTAAFIPILKKPVTEMFRSSK